MSQGLWLWFLEECLLISIYSLSFVKFFSKFIGVNSFSMEEVTGAPDGAVGKVVIGSSPFNPINVFFFQLSSQIQDS